MKLHIGGTTRADGWVNLNIVPGEDVDIVGSCLDLSAIASESCTHVYTSHVFEHILLAETTLFLAESYRVLKPGGNLYISVPDILIISNLFQRVGGNIRDKFVLMKIIFGGQSDEYDVHKFGYDFDMLQYLLERGGFRNIRRVDDFGFFRDGSALASINGMPISLNVIATKPD